MNYSFIGERIRCKRKEQGITQEKLAELIDASVSFVGHIERGTRKMSLNTFFLICQTLHMSADDALGL